MGGADPHRIPKAGTLLVASPRMLDPNFMHTVLLLCEHGPTGSFGLVLNRPLPLRVADLASDVPLLAARDESLWAGGPVQTDSLQVIHRLECGVPDSLPVVDGIRFGGDPVVLRQAFLDEPSAPRKFVLGYSGWGEGQLDAEMGEGAWIVVRATAKRVFDPAPDTLWRRVLRAEGGDVADLADVPPDPSWN